MAPKIARLRAIGFAIASLIGAAAQPEDLAAAIAAEGAACSASGDPKSCDLHLLQLRAQGLGGVVGGDSRSEAPDLVGAQEQISDMEASSLVAEIQDEFRVSGHPSDVRTEDSAVEEHGVLVLGGAQLGDAAGVEAHGALEVPSSVDMAGTVEEHGVPVAADAAGVTAHGVLEVPSSADMAGTAASVESPDAIGAPGSTEIVHTAAAGRCSAQDEALMMKMGGGSRAGSFPAEVADCGRHAYKWFRFQSDDMAACISKKSGISARCASCFGKAGQYGLDHCEAQCRFGEWCSHMCMGCTRKGNVATEGCVGLSIAVPQPDWC